MYIVFETLASDDPRLDSRMNIFGKFWHYQIAYIAPEHEADVYLKWLKHEVISKEVAETDKLASAVDGEISLLVRDFGTYKEILSPTSYGNNGYHKQNYFLTDKDIKNATELLKAILRLHIDAHLKEGEGENVNPVGTRERLLKKVNALSNLNDAQVFFQDYLDTQLSAYVVGLQKNPEFNVIWDF